VKKTKIEYIGLMIFICLLYMGLVGGGDLEEQIRAEEMYCSMVKLHRDSSGEYGWPAYRGEEAYCEETSP
jgi:hypothetical protein